MSHRVAPPLLAVVALLIVAAQPAIAAIKTNTVDYTVGGAKYIGYLAFDDSTNDKTPGVLIAPEWIGLNDYSRDRAKQLAALGYVAFVFDPYGEGKNAADVKQAAEWSSALKANRPELRARINAALETLKKQDRVDPKKTAAIGYCFGGTGVLELARSGADVLGVVSFHGGLAAPLPAKAGEMKSRILVCHGAEDPFVKSEEVAEFEKEMREAKADWQLISYGNAVHSFTNPAAKGQLPGAKYNEAADKRSWSAMKGFLTDLFVHREASTNDLFKGMEAGKRIVFVCDASGRMINGMAFLKASLTKAIESLEVGQSYNVMFFSEGGRMQAVDRKALIPVSEINNQKCMRFFEEVTAFGEADPIPATEAAFRMQPDLIYFLAKGEFGDAEIYADFTRSVARMDPQRQVKVNTITFLAYARTASEILISTAKDSGGRYRLIFEQDLKD